MNFPRSLSLTLSLTLSLSLSLSILSPSISSSHVLSLNYIPCRSQINTFVIPYIHNEIEMCHPHCNYMQLSKCGTQFSFPSPRGPSFHRFIQFLGVNDLSLKQGFRIHAKNTRLIVRYNDPRKY